MQAPDFTLRDVDGRGHSLSLALAHGPVVLFFFKTTCPTSRLMAPLVARLTGATVWTVSQDRNADTRRFAQEVGWNSPPLLDLTLSASRAYGVEVVPTTFLVGTGGEVERTLVAFDAAALNEMAAVLGSPEVAPSGDGGPVFKPG